MSAQHTAVAALAVLMAAAPARAQAPKITTPPKTVVISPVKPVAVTTTRVSAPVVIRTPAITFIGAGPGGVTITTPAITFAGIPAGGLVINTPAISFVGGVGGKGIMTPAITFIGVPTGPTTITTDPISFVGTPSH